MTIFYRRKETPREITICFKYSFVFYLVFLAGVLAVFYLREIANTVWNFIWIFFIVYFLDLFKPGQEIGRAMKTGYVKFTGSKYSLKRPLTAVIEKIPEVKEDH